MFDIISCGSATVDVFANTQSELIKIKTASSSETLIAYPSGSKILIKNLLFTIGGGGTNTAVGFSRLGLKTGYIGCLGDDENAHHVLACLKKEKVKFLGHSTNNHTGYSVILDSIEHDRTVLTYKGANDELTFSKIKKNPLTKWFYFSSMMGESLLTQKKIAAFAKKKGIKIAYNPSLYQCKLGISRIHQILEATSIFICNKEEAQALLNESSIEEIVKKLHLFGISISIITDGPHTLHCYDGKKLYALHPQHVKVLEATGAGDAFASGFVACYIKTEDITQSLKWGLHNSQSVLTCFGAKEKLLTQNAIAKITKQQAVDIQIQ